ncbi:MAG: hypothetical protein IJS33_05385 [Firmicutes bacterium]|nr:hypothetical protein [Bacillota bacterium]
MFKNFADIFIGFLAASSLGGLTLMVLVALMGFGYMASLIVLVLWFIFCGVFFSWFAKRRVDRLDGLLNNCQVSEYVEAYDKIEARIYLGGGKRTALMNKARGLIALGAVDEAINDLTEIGLPEKHRFKDMHLQAVLNSMLFSAYVEKGELEHAVKALSVCKYMVGDRLYRQPYLSRMIEIINRAEMRLALAEGEFEGMEEQYKKLLEDAETLIEEVIAHYRLAEIAEHYGREDEKREHLEFAAKHGGTTIYRYLAGLALGGGEVQDKAMYNGPIDER